MLGSLLSLMMALAPPGPTASPSPGRAEWDVWRQKRQTSLGREDGWLSLVGLFWLEPGENKVGSAKGASVRLPASVPADLGSISVTAGKVVYRPGAAEASANGREVKEPLPLTSDLDGEPTLLRHGTVSFYLIRRGDRLGVRAKDSASPLRSSFRGIEMWPYDEAWRKTARFERYDPPRQIPVPNVSGSIDPTRSPGALVFEAGGKTWRLDAVQESEEADLWLIFGDATNGRESYGGGRFLYAKPAGADGTTVLDFNRSYNPPCVFTPYATCPLPPAQNKLPISVEAGEKSWGEH